MNNLVPDGWSTKTVGELSNVKRGASPRPIKDPKWWGGNVGWVRISDVTSSRKYLSKTTQYLSNEGVRKSVQIAKGEVVLSICATIGRPIIIKVDACVHDGFVWFHDLDRSIDREFWYYFLSSKESFLASQRQSGTQGNLNTSIVSDLLCLLPPLPEQQKIAVILTSVDELIEKAQAQIDKLKDLKTAMMQELLSPIEGSYTDTDGNAIPFKDSLLGRVPEGWEVKLCSDVCLKITDGEHISPKYVNNGFPILSAKDIQVYGIDFSGAKFVSKDAYEKMLKRCNPEYGDVLIVSRGATIGKTTLNISTKSFALMGSVILLKPKIDCCYGAYLSLFIAQPEIRLKLLQLSGSSAQQAIYLKDIKEMVVPLPPMTEQKEIADATISIDYRIVAVEKKLLAMKHTKKALMQDLLTGKVRVNID